MSEPTAPEATAPTTPAEGGKTFTQDEVNNLIAREKGVFQQKYADYDDLREKASRFDELEEAGRTDLERATTERDQLKTELTTSQVENLRLRVALEKKLPVELIDRLKGSSEEEFKADADALLQLVKPAEEKPPSFDGGARSSAPASDMNTFIRSGARRDR